MTSFLGSTDCTEWIKTTLHQLENHTEIPQAKDLASTIAETKKTVCQWYDVDEKN